MADIPRDPRQLARDILAGKISLEDVAREQARRAGLPPPQARPGGIQRQKLPDRIPLPRQLPQQPVRRPPPPQPVRQPQSRKAAPPAPQRRPASRSFPPSGPPPAPPAANLPVPARQALAPLAAAVPPVSPMRSSRSSIRQNLRTPATLRQAILLAEILGPPVALRES